MAAEGLDDSIFNVTEARSQSFGPLFADDEECMCALQFELGKEAWRCLANFTSNIYSGQTGKWFFAVNQANPASLQKPINSDSNPPDVGTAYVIQGDGHNGEFVDITHEKPSIALGDMTCSGNNDTEVSSALYKHLPAARYLSACWQPGTTPLIIQNASEWNATGCNLGFLCKYSPDVSRTI